MIFDVGPMPLPVPSASGLANSGYASFTASASSGRSTTMKSGVGTPRSRMTRLVIALCSDTASTAGSEKVYGMRWASSMAGTRDSRPSPYNPSQMLNTRSQRWFFESRSASAPALPMRTVAWPARRTASSIASTVSSRSSSAVSSSE